MACIWRAYQERISQGEFLVHLDDPIELLPPEELPLSQIVIDGRRSLRALIFLEALLAWGMIPLYLAWAQSYFRWPPNEQLSATTWGTIGIIFLIGTFAIWRKRPFRIVADQVGISVHEQNQDRMIFWSEVQQLLLDPISMQNDPPALAEDYHIMTAGLPLDLSVPLDVGPLKAAFTLTHDKQKEIRSLIALAMHETGLPLIADSKAWEKRNYLLALQADKPHQIQWHITYMVIALILLGLAGGLGYNFHPNSGYHVITGQLAYYSVEDNHNIATIQIKGDAASYTLTTVGIYPHPPDSLPTGAFLTMQVDGKDVGLLDVNTLTAQWHIVTQSYAEPWFNWLELIFLESFLVIPAILILFDAFGYFLQGRRRLTTEDQEYSSEEVPE